MNRVLLLLQRLAPALLALAALCLPALAATAARRFLQPRYVIPMHYGANPLAKGTPAQFLQAMVGSDIAVLVPEPGEILVFDGHKLQH